MEAIGAGSWVAEWNIQLISFKAAPISIVQAGEAD